MDGREAMAFPGVSSTCYIHRRGPFSTISAPRGGVSALQARPGLRPLSNTNLASQSSAGPPPFSVCDPQLGDFSHRIHMPMERASSATFQQPPDSVMKKKRGRPRKYAPPDGQVVSLGLSPVPAANKAKGSSRSDNQMPKRARGRPPGTGKKQRLANLGEWMNSSAGIAFAPHVISVGVGEDIVSKILSFSQQRPRAVSILSGSGSVSSITLRQPASAVPSFSFEVVACSFVYGGSRVKIEQDVSPKEENIDCGPPGSAPPVYTSQHLTSATDWP